MTIRTIRHVVQPGTAAPDRIQWVEAHGRAFSCRLEAGLPLLEAARRGFEAAGFRSGTMTVTTGALGPLAYVKPSLPRTAEHAAYYSDVFRPSGAARLDFATMTFGERDGAPFFHCHGFWREADGRPGGGHVLPEETVVAEPCQADAFGLDGALFDAAVDPETNFKLFGPVASPRLSAHAGPRAFALRLRPNQDFAETVESFCRARGIARAKLHGGVGSIIGARFTDGRVVEPFATEMAVRSGTIGARASGPEAEFDVSLVDHLGGLASGKLIRGDNPVLMTMEVVLEVID